VAVDPRAGSEVPGAWSSGRRRSLVVAVVVLALMAIAAGCGESDDGLAEPRVPPTDAGDTTTTTSTTVPTTTTTIPATTTTFPPTTAPAGTTTLPPPSTEASTTVPPSSTAPAGGPGAPCDPADGDPNCTDQTNDGQFRIVAGFADCVADNQGDTGICADLDGDGQAMYPDSG